jgi:UDP-glucose 4-epimerase
MNMTRCSVAVTGGAGFIGSHLVDRLLDRGNHVLVIDDFSTGSLDHLRHHDDNPNLRVVDADIRDAAAMHELLRGIDFVFHLATRNVRLSLTQPSLVHDVNVNGTYTLLKAAAACQVRRLLYCSSSEVNGTADIVPMPEEYHYRPETIYGASKLMGEYYANVFHRSGWLPTVIARPHNNYGPREHYAGNKGEVIPRFILWALTGQPLPIYGDGRQTRDFTYVTETADYLVRLVECPQALGQTFNICRGEEVSIRRIAELIRELTQSSSLLEQRPGRPHDVLRLFGDPTRLRTTLGSAPTLAIREGLARTIAWFRTHVGTGPEVMQTLDQATWQQATSEPWLNHQRPNLRSVA